MRRGSQKSGRFVEHICQKRLRLGCQFSTLRRCAKPSLCAPIFHPVILSKRVFARRYPAFHVPYPVPTLPRGHPIILYPFVAPFYWFDFRALFVPSVLV